MRLFIELHSEKDLIKPNKLYAIHSLSSVSFYAYITLCCQPKSFLIDPSKI
jgi:hypothetical protein